MENCSNNVEMKLDPLLDDDFSELTKSEILRWAQILNITPSELYSLSQKDLAQLLSLHLSKEMADSDAEKFIKDHEEKEMKANDARKARWQRLRAMKSILLKQQKERLKGGDECRTIWQILTSAGSEIERMYGKAGESRSRGSGRQSSAMQQRCCGGAVGSSGSADMSFRPSPMKGSILKSNPGRKSKFFYKAQPTPSYAKATYEDTVVARTPKGLSGKQSYNSSQTDSGLGVTFSQSGKDGGPSFIQGALGVDEAIFSQGPRRAKSPSILRCVKNSLADTDDDEIFNSRPPIRKGDYPTFVQGAPCSPQRNQSFIQRSPGRGVR